MYCSHFKIICSCDEVIIECICDVNDKKVVEVIEDGCTECMFKKLQQNILNITQDENEVIWLEEDAGPEYWMYKEDTQCYMMKKTEEEIEKLFHL